MVSDIYKISDKFGMDDGSLELAMREHEEGLAVYSTEKINWAFKEWRRLGNTKFPWFPDIRNLIENRPFRDEAGGKIKKYSEWDGGWDSYKRYLHKHGLLNPNLIDTL